MITILIPGKPIAKQRPRFARIGKGVRTYSAQETEEGRFLMHLIEQVKDPLDGPLAVSMQFFMQRPKSHFGTGKNVAIKKPSAPEWPTSKPDLDNYVKFAWDCCNGVVWRDDAQVVRVLAEKRYAKDSCTIIFVNEIAAGVCDE